MSDLDLYLETALSLADRAAAPARTAWCGDIAVTYKQDGSSLTEADLAIEAIWRQHIADRFPDHGILGEEYGRETGRSAYTWVLDPIDGTRQFGAGLLNFASLISVCRDGVPVIGVIDLPLAGARYHAAEGAGSWFGRRRVRSSDTATLGDARISLANPDSFDERSRPGFERLRQAGRLNLFDGGAPAYGALARGLIDICLNGDDLDAYDICALCPVVTEAGGAITDWAGDGLSLASSGAIAASANKSLHAMTLEQLAPCLQDPARTGTIPTSRPR